jgi:hypothetical protein
MVQGNQPPLAYGPAAPNLPPQGLADHLLRRLGEEAPTERLRFLGHNALGGPLQIGDAYQEGRYDEALGKNMIDVGEVTGFMPSGRPVYKRITTQEADVVLGRKEAPQTTHLDEAAPTTRVMPPVKPPEQPTPAREVPAPPVQPPQAAQSPVNEAHLTHRRPKGQQQATKPATGEQPASTNEPAPSQSQQPPTVQEQTGPGINFQPPTETDPTAGMSADERIQYLLQNTPAEQQDVALPRRPQPQPVATEQPRSQPEGTPVQRQQPVAIPQDRTTPRVATPQGPRPQPGPVPQQATVDENEIFVGGVPLSQSEAQQEQDWLPGGQLRNRNRQTYYD